MGQKGYSSKYKDPNSTFEKVDRHFGKLFKKKNPNPYSNSFKSYIYTYRNPNPQYNQFKSYIYIHISKFKFYRC